MIYGFFHIPKTKTRGGGEEEIARGKEDRTSVGLKTSHESEMVAAAGGNENEGGGGGGKKRSPGGM